MSSSNVIDGVYLSKNTPLDLCVYMCVPWGSRMYEICNTDVA